MTDKRLTVRLSEHGQVVGLERNGVDVAVPVDRSDWVTEVPAGHGPSSSEDLAPLATWPLERRELSSHRNPGATLAPPSLAVDLGQPCERVVVPAGAAE